MPLCGEEGMGRKEDEAQLKGSGKWKGKSNETSSLRMQDLGLRRAGWSDGRKRKEKKSSHTKHVK